MDVLKDLAVQIELHSLEGIRQCFSKGVNPNERFKGKPLIDELISEYTRSPRFRLCVQIFVEYGLEFEDKALLAVLLDDADSLAKFITSQPETINKTYSLPCAYTPLYETNLLHICAEFNHVNCAKILVKNGADINAKAGVDEYGFGGHSPIFHTVNQNSNQSADMMAFLLGQSADLGMTVKGLIWGKGYPWETFIPAVNPISYAMMGCLPQMHRNERTVAQTVATLMNHAFGIDYVQKNIPNEYLAQRQQ